ncbi:MAG TPA: ATP-binding cassette domain-containing protein, partial [Candidatus Poseidoniales archaeon]|nr:ATP-binding cassette domain-containing protein [Candidatus Poseidoniales archaeon]
MSGGATATVHLEEVSKSFRHITAVDRVNIKLEESGIIALVGGNGAGKTTLLRLMSTVLEPDAGTVTIRMEGDENKALPRRHLGILPEGTGLYQRLTAWENVRYHSRLHGVEDGIARERCESMATQLGILTDLNRATRGFSRGMRQKTALMRALIHEPPILLLDEPTGGLDVTSAREVRSMVRRIADEGRIIVYSTHQLEEAARICDRMIVMHNGRVVADGRTEEMLEPEAEPIPDLLFPTLNRTGIESQITNDTGWFQLSDHPGKVVIIDMMAHDCSNCHDVQNHIEDEMDGWYAQASDRELLIIGYGAWYQESLTYLNMSEGAYTVPRYATGLGSTDAA